MLYDFYLKFCASINFFFERKLNYDDPGIFSLLFVTVIEIVYFFGILYSVQLILGRRLFLPTFVYFVVFGLFVVLNYLFAFRREQLYRVYKSKLSLIATLCVIVFGYLFMGITGSLCRNYL